MKGEERVSVHNRQRKFRINLSQIRSNAARVLRYLKKEGATVNLLFVNDAAIRKINRKFRNLNESTDVLSFPGGDPLPGAKEEWLGDIVISVETADRQAKQIGHSRAREMQFLIIHGLLHLLGWDHDRSPAEAKEMYRMQREILERLKC